MTSEVESNCYEMYARYLFFLELLHHSIRGTRKCLILRLIKGMINQENEVTLPETSTWIYNDRVQKRILELSNICGAAKIYLFKVKKSGTRKLREIYSKLYMFKLFLVFLLLPLSK